MPDRRTTVADAALQVLAERGLRGMTHRAVDAAAGLPEGSTSNVFRTRQALVDGVVARAVELDLAALAADSTVPDLSSPTALARQIAERARALAVAPMDRITRARMELALHPEIDLSAQHDGFRAILTSLLVEVGATDPGGSARAIADYLDGVLLHVVAMGSRRFDVEEVARSVEALIRVA